MGAIGVALFTVAVGAGQSSCSLFVDQAGLGPAGRQRITPVRVAGALLTVVAVCLAVAERLGGADALSWSVAALALLPLVAGCGAAYQQAVNGQVHVVGGPWATTWNNFLVGTSLLLVLLAFSLAFPGDLDTPPSSWWLYSGGLIGVAVAASPVLRR